MISIIVATAENGVIGKSGGLPWYLPAELAYFKKTTMRHPIIMGRRTYESIGRALPGRTNIVITHDKTYEAEGCIVIDSLEKAIEKAKKSEGSDEIFIIGGESVYKEALPLAGRLYLTKVKATIDGDKFFKYNPANWKQVISEKHSSNEKNSYEYDFTVCQRIS
ncbi:MAG: dihydrofolate reductase [Candidatus Saccharimonadales bacterium]